MSRRKFPIGIQTFARIREADYYCVDKTAFALSITDPGKGLRRQIPVALPAHPPDRGEFSKKERNVAGFAAECLDG